jgi:hypothetical protein
MTTDLVPAKEGTKTVASNAATAVFLSSLSSLPPAAVQSCREEETAVISQFSFPPSPPAAVQNYHEEETAVISQFSLTPSPHAAVQSCREEETAVITQFSFIPAHCCSSELSRGGDSCRRRPQLGNQLEQKTTSPRVTSGMSVKATPL